VCALSPLPNSFIYFLILSCCFCFQVPSFGQVPCESTFLFQLPTHGSPFKQHPSPPLLEIVFPTNFRFSRCPLCDAAAAVRSPFPISTNIFEIFQRHCPSRRIDLGLPSFFFQFLGPNVTVSESRMFQGVKIFFTVFQVIRTSFVLSLISEFVRWIPVTPFHAEFAYLPCQLKIHLSNVWKLFPDFWVET